MNNLIINSINKSYTDPTKKTLQVLQGFSLTIKEGSIHAIFGPNGSGKSTLLKIIAGQEQVQSGSTTSQKPIGFLFQNYRDTLLPWNTVKHNLTLFANIKNATNQQKTEALNRFNLKSHQNKYPYQLSGGLAQSLALSRELIHKPKTLLLDEPFSALDYSNSRIHWLEFLTFWNNHKPTTLIVSHNIDEAIFLSDKITVLSKAPTNIMGTIDINLPRPRTLEALKSPEFFKLRNQVLTLFEKGYE